MSGLKHGFCVECKNHDLPLWYDDYLFSGYHIGVCSRCFRKIMNSSFNKIRKSLKNKEFLK